MSKLTKLINSPDLFLKDFLKKRGVPAQILNLNSRNAQLPPPNKTPAKPKSTPSASTNKPKTTASVAKPKVTLPTVILSHIRLFKRTAHLLHTGEGMTHGPSHLKQWVGSFMLSGEVFAVLIRDAALYKWAINEYPYLDIVFAKNPTDVENVLEKLPYLKAIYYFSNTGNLIHTLRYNCYSHIFLGHGDSDKAASAHKFFRVYDEVWVAGDAHIDRFKNAGFSVGHMNFVKIGRPNLQAVLQKSLEKKQANYTLSALNKVLYLPTWEGVYEENNYSSARLSVVMLSELNSRFNCDVMAKYHPVTGSRDKSLATIPSSLKEVFVGKEQSLTVATADVPVANLLPYADAFICDISAVVTECISGLAPIFVYIPSDREIRVSQSEMSYEDYAYTFSNVEELMEKLHHVFIDGNDYLAEARFKALDYLLSIDATIQNEFFTQLKRIERTSTLVENQREEVIQ